MICVGDDWAEDHHDIELVDEAGTLTRARLPEGLDGITRFHALIAQHVPPEWADLDPVEVAGKGAHRNRDRPRPMGAGAGRRRLPGIPDQPDVGGPLPGTTLHLRRQERRRRCACPGRDRAPRPRPSPPAGR